MSLATRTIYSPNYYRQGWIYGPPKVVFIHSTRSGIEGHPHEKELAATIGHFCNPNSQASAQWVLSPTERVRMVGDDKPSWCTGFHNFEGYNIELTQPTLRTPYQPGHYRNLAIVCAPYVRQGIPIVWLDYWAYAQDQPRGFVGHEDTQQGRSVGKSDPGPMFNVGEFFRELRLQVEPEQEDDMDEATVRRLAREETVPHLEVLRAMVDEIRTALLHPPEFDRDRPWWEPPLTKAVKEHTADLAPHLSIQQIMEAFNASHMAGLASKCPLRDRPAGGYTMEEILAAVLDSIGLARKG